MVSRHQKWPYMHALLQRSTVLDQQPGDLHEVGIDDL